MPIFAKFSFRFPGITSPNAAFVMMIGCTGLWVLARCLLDASQLDRYHATADIAFLAFLGWRAWVIASAPNIRHHELILLPPTLLWTTWMAYRGTDFFVWWLPPVLLAVFLASSQLVFFILSISVMLISIMLMLGQQAIDSLGIIGSTAIATSMVALYRTSKDHAEAEMRLRKHHLRFLHDAARLWHAELDTNGELLSTSALLMNQLGLTSKPDALMLSEVVHPGDVSLVIQTCREAMDQAPGVVTSAASCNCRLRLQNGGSLWVHAQFVRTARSRPGTLVTFMNIDERLRMEEALRSSQRKLASQAVELSAQFDAAKSALHARQEVERLAQHDLRSPLKSIEAAAALLRKGRILSNTEEHLLTSIEHTAARALAMVTMSLDLYRMEEGTFRFVPETIDLVTIGRGVIAELGHHARTKNVQLEFNASASALKAVGNPLLTASVVENLVRNAMEAAPEHSVVTLGLYQGARVGLLIHNEGEVDESIRKDFFEKYVTHGKRQGLGLGTYSARLIARAQGGDLTMTSSAKDGTLLVLKLRRSANESDESANTRSHVDSFGPSVPGNLIEIPTSSHSEVRQSPLDLLLVDDDDHNWLLLLSWLPKHVGARRAINGREAVDALTSKRPDLVLMDLEMPVMNGFEALERIRDMQASAGEEPSIIYALTGYDDSDTMQRIRSAGFDGLVTKPVQKKELEDILNMVSTTTMSATIQGELWIEKNFVDAFPAFLDSRRALISDIEQAARAGDLSAMRRAAHTLAGSPAIHGFNTGISICRRIISMANNQNISELDELVTELKKLLSKPNVR